jgi:hypothetical protein
VAVVPEPSRIGLPSGAVQRYVVSCDPDTPMPNIHISVRCGIRYVHEAWNVGSIGISHAVLPPAFHISAVGLCYCKVSHPMLYSMAVIPNFFSK